MLACFRSSASFGYSSVRDFITSGGNSVPAWSSVFCGAWFATRTGLRPCPRRRGSSVRRELFRALAGCAGLTRATVGEVVSAALGPAVAGLVQEEIFWEAVRTRLAEPGTGTTVS